MLDVVYPVRPGEDNEELRFSLRSLRNLPHGRVWIVGHKPAWVKGVEFIPGNLNRRHLRANIYHNLLAATKHPDMAEEFVIFNDDFYVTTPVGSVPVWFRSTLCEHLQWPKIRTQRGWWWESLATTVIALQVLGLDDPISYELHTPFPVNRQAMREALEMFAHVTPHNPPQWRSLYGNLHGIGGVKATDGKAMRPGPLTKPFHSTDDTSWRYFRRQYLEVFPDPSPYERGLSPSAGRGNPRSRVAAL